MSNASEKDGDIGMEAIEQIKSCLEDDFNHWKIDREIDMELLQQNCTGFQFVSKDSAIDKKNF